MIAGLFYHITQGSFQNNAEYDNSSSFKVHL